MRINFKSIKKSFTLKLIKPIKKKLDEYLKRRPHRSFLLTRRRDYRRSMKMPGFIAFTKYVNKLLWSNRKVFLLLVLVYAVLTALMVGMSSQETYTALQSTVKDTGGDIVSGSFGSLGQAGILFLSSINGGLSGTLSEIQQIFALILFIMAWLSCVWLLRNILANRKVKLRDGLYNAGAPILPTFLVSFMVLLQLLPLAIAIIGYSAAATTGLLENGIEAMLFWAAAGLLTLLSIYLLTGTIFALIIITLPGMYPMAAIRAASDLVVGRRLRIITRFIWMFVYALSAWAIVMIPIILLDSWLKDIWPAIEWLPIVPIFILAMTSLTTVWVSTYVYLFYRKVVDDGAAPA